MYSSTRMTICHERHRFQKTQSPSSGKEFHSGFLYDNIYTQQLQGKLTPGCFRALHASSRWMDFFVTRSQGSFVPPTWGARIVWYFHQGKPNDIGYNWVCSYFSSIMQRFSLAVRPRTSLSLNASAGCNVFLETLVYNLGAQKKMKENIFSSF